jgi:hypothetical protein
LGYDKLPVVTNRRNWIERKKEKILSWTRDECADRQAVTYSTVNNCKWNYATLISARTCASLI